MQPRLFATAQKSFTPAQKLRQKELKTLSKDELIEQAKKDYADAELIFKTLALSKNLNWEDMRQIMFTYLTYDEHDPKGDALADIARDYHHKQLIDTFWQGGVPREIAGAKNKRKYDWGNAAWRQDPPNIVKKPKKSNELLKTNVQSEKKSRYSK